MPLAFGTQSGTPIHQSCDRHLITFGFSNKLVETNRHVLGMTCRHFLCVALQGGSKTKRSGNVKIIRQRCGYGHVFVEFPVPVGRIEGIAIL